MSLGMYITRLTKQLYPFLAPKIKKKESSTSRNTSWMERNRMLRRISAYQGC